MCYIIMPVVAGVLVFFSSFSSLWALFSMDWIVGPQGGWGIPTVCNSQKMLQSPISMGQLNNLGNNDQGNLKVNMCDKFDWSLYTTTLEQVMAIFCMVGCGIGIIALILIIFEVIFRFCFKPHPITPKITAFLCFLQFLVIGALAISYAGKISFLLPEGYKLGVTFYMIIVSIVASLVASVLMMFAAKSERKRYDSRFNRTERAPGESATNLSTTQLDNKKGDPSVA